MSAVFQPRSVADAQSWVAEQAVNQAPFHIVGAGTRYAPQGRILSTRNLTALRFLEPENMVVGVDAGVPFAQLQRQLAVHKMRLPVNPWFRGATVGGVFAANDEGPERVMTGGLRDFVIGIEMIGASGRLVKAGGRVVKNVSGYDLPRAMCGSLGGLALITSLNFKVMPAPLEPQSLLATLTPAQVVAGMAAFRKQVHLAAMPLRWTHMVHCKGRWQLGLGFDGRETRRDQIATDLQHAMAAFQPQVVAEAETPSAYLGFSPQDRDQGFLSPLVDELGGLGGHVYLNTTVRHATNGTWLLQLASLCDTLVVMPAAGSIHLLWRAALDQTTIQPVLRACQQDHVQRWVCAGTSKLTEHYPWVSPLPPAWQWMQRLKTELDPHRLFHAPFYEQLS